VNSSPEKALKEAEAQCSAPGGRGFFGKGMVEVLLIYK
jgi:hypothetical protein